MKSFGETFLILQERFAVLLQFRKLLRNLQRKTAFLQRMTVDNRAAPAKFSETEPYHWKGLILQSFAFDMLSNATRVITADQNDRHLPGIGTPPRLSFLSHDNYINSTNWGVSVGPVLRF